MADCLLVIDMQADYVGKNKLHANPQLVTAVNQKIAAYPADCVIYIVNRFFWDLTKKPKDFTQGLSVVSDSIFEKRRASGLTNLALLNFLKNSKSQALELIGVDGNGCIRATALAAAKAGFQVSLDLSCIGAANKTAFQRTQEKCQK